MDFPTRRAIPNYPPQPLPAVLSRTRTSVPIRCPIVVGSASAGQFGCCCSCCCCLIVPYVLVEQIQYRLPRGARKGPRPKSPGNCSTKAAGHDWPVSHRRQGRPILRRRREGLAERGRTGQRRSIVLPLRPGRGLREQDQGSGVIVDAEGYIITNYHVVDHATDVERRIERRQQASGRNRRHRSGHRPGRLEDRRRRT